MLGNRLHLCSQFMNRVIFIIGRLGWVYRGPIGLGNGPHVLGNRPCVLGNGLHLCSQFMNRVIFIMGR